MATKKKQIETKYSNYSIAAIAAVIRHEWKNVYFGAKPYLDAMFSLTSIRDNYGMDSGRDIVLYALSNMSGFKGEIAREVKKELNARL